MTIEQHESGKSSEKPTNESDAFNRLLPRFGALNVFGHESSVMPCVDPEKSAR